MSNGLAGRDHRWPITHSDLNLRTQTVGIRGLRSGLGPRSPALSVGQAGLDGSQLLSQSGDVIAQVSHLPPETLVLLDQPVLSADR